MELARKLAREMDAHRTVSVSRVYAPNEYAVWLSPRDRARYEGVEEEAARRAVRLPARARPRRGPALASPPAIAFHTDSRSRSGSSASRRGWCGPTAARGAGGAGRGRPGGADHGGADHGREELGGRGGEGPGGRGAEGPAVRGAARPAPVKRGRSPPGPRRDAHFRRRAPSARARRGGGPALPRDAAARRPPPADRARRRRRSAAAATATSCSTTPGSHAGTPDPPGRRRAGRSRTSARPTACSSTASRCRRHPLHAGGPHRARLDRGRVRAAMTTLAAGLGGAQVRLPRRAVPVPAVGRAQRAARPARRGRGAQRPADRGVAGAPLDATGLHSASAPGRADLVAPHAAPGRRARARARAGDDLRPRRRRRARPRRPRRDPPRGPLRLLAPRARLRAGRRRSCSRTSARPTAPTSTRSCWRPPRPLHPGDRRSRADRRQRVSPFERPRAADAARRRAVRGHRHRVASGAPTRTPCSRARRCSWSPTAWAARRPARSPRRSRSRPSHDGPRRRRRHPEREPRRAARSAANARIHALSHANAEQAGMGTTLTAVYVGEEEVAIAHVGRQPRLLPARRRAAAPHRRPLARRRADAPGPAHPRGSRGAPAALDHHARARPRARRRGRHALRSARAAATSTCCAATASRRWSPRRDRRAPARPRAEPARRRRGADRGRQRGGRARQRHGRAVPPRGGRGAGGHRRRGRAGRDRRTPRSPASPPPHRRARRRRDRRRRATTRRRGGPGDRAGTPTRTRRARPAAGTRAGRPPSRAARTAPRAARCVAIALVVLGVLAARRAYWRCSRCTSSAPTPRPGDDVRGPALHAPAAACASTRRYFVSGVSASTLEPARDSMLLNHELRSKRTPPSLVRSLELGQLEWSAARREPADPAPVRAGRRAVRAARRVHLALDGVRSERAARKPAQQARAARAGAHPARRDPRRRRHGARAQRAQREGATSGPTRPARCSPSRSATTTRSRSGARAWSATATAPRRADAAERTADDPQPAPGQGTEGDEGRHHARPAAQRVAWQRSAATQARSWRVEPARAR